MEEGLLKYNGIKYFENSLSHRLIIEIKLIMDAYYGSITWQQIER